MFRFVVNGRGKLCVEILAFASLFGFRRGSEREGIARPAAKCV